MCVSVGMVCVDVYVSQTANGGQRAILWSPFSPFMWVQKR